jgi:hypothetical protein
MSNISVVDIAKRVVKAVESGGTKIVDQTAFAKLQQQLAQEQFPDDKIGVALSKFYATPHGAAMLNAVAKILRDDAEAQRIGQRR